MKFRTGYNYDTNAASRESGLECKDPSMTVQSEKVDADINTLVKRFGLVGTMPANPRVPMYGDFSNLTDYRSALEAIRQADASFMELTPEVRSRFLNSPQKLLEFCADERNREEAVKLGLLKAAVAPAPSAAAPAVPPAA